MQRVRMSLPYFKELGWDAEVVIVDSNYIDAVKDDLLLESVPENIVIHKVKAFSKKITSKIGLGSLALRSILYYKKKVDQLLLSKKFDLIYFSTTQFPVCILGAYWKKKHGIPYVIDMQDPWHSDYYKNKPKAERPKKYWISYRLNKYFEPIAMKNVDGLISVSKAYIDTLKQRYPQLQHIPSEVITFGAFDVDFKIAAKYANQLNIVFDRFHERINLVYIGRGGYDMRESLQILFECFKSGLKNDNNFFKKIHFNFIGTSYAPNGTGIQTIKPIAEEFGLANYVTEFTDRIGFFQSIRNLQAADGLIIIGSNDSSYTASKIFPYILTHRPTLAILHPESSAGAILKACNAGELITLQDDIAASEVVFKKFIEQIIHNRPIEINFEVFAPYTSAYLTKMQTDLFDKVLLK
jgi:hypothetical protein